MTRVNEEISNQSAITKNLTNKDQDPLEERTSRSTREEMLQSKIRILQEEVAALLTQLNAESLHAPESSPNVGQISSNKRTYEDSFGASQDQSSQKERVSNE